MQYLNCRSWGLKYNYASVFIFVTKNNPLKPNLRKIMDIDLPKCRHGIQELIDMKI